MQSGGKGALRSIGSKFINDTALDDAPAVIRHKQIARAVKGQTLRVTQSGGKGGSRSVWFIFKDAAAVVIRYVEIARVVKG